MFTLNGVNFEFPQMGKEPKIGYTDEFVDKTMLSGRIRRIHRGRRFNAVITYAYLLETERVKLDQIMDAQAQNGYVTVQLDTPKGTYTGAAIVSLNTAQTRFSYSNVLNDYVWTNWELTLSGMSYVESGEIS